MDLHRFVPGYWTQNYPTHSGWDAALNDLLDTHGVTDITTYTCNIGGVTVWISNWPYAYGRCYQPSAEALPKVATRKRLRDAIVLAVIDKARGAS